MSDFVELNPEQAEALLAAYWAEQNRHRHEAEPWESQAMRDAAKRDRLIEEAWDLKVPRGQVHRFVFFEEVSDDDD